MFLAFLSVPLSFCVFLPEEAQRRHDYEGGCVQLWFLTTLTLGAILSSLFGSVTVQETVHVSVCSLQKSLLKLSVPQKVI